MSRGWHQKKWKTHKPDVKQKQIREKMSVTIAEQRENKRRIIAAKIIEARKQGLTLLEIAKDLEISSGYAGNLSVRYEPTLKRKRGCSKQKAQDVIANKERRLTAIKEKKRTETYCQ